MPPTPKTAEAVTQQNAPSATKTVVLVVDDEHINRVILCRLLEREGYETREAEDGPEALAAISQFKFDMVLLDIVMPELDGFAVLERIRTEHDESELPVIMVTASEESEQIVRALHLGANDYLTKPIDPPVTLARIKMHLRLKYSQEALKKSEERYSLVARGTNDGLWDWDLDKNEIYYSPRWLSMVALEDDSDTSPEVWFSRIHAEDLLRVESEIEKHLIGMTPQFETELRMRHADGNFRWMLCRGLAVWDETGTPHRMAGSLTDITEGKVADALTGLPNRVLFRERLERCMSRTIRNNDFKFALLYLDLDNFKLVNDSLGHEAGDRLLVSVARRLENSLRLADSLVSRLGGDEFAIILEGINSANDAIQVANRIIASVSAPISIGSTREVFASVSVGISTSDDGYEDALGVLQAADTAMYHAKEQGKSCYRLFDPIMKEHATRRLDIDNELRHAVERDELQLHYQPMVEIASSRIVGFEALARWNHPRLGRVSPAEFIPVAEDSGLILTIGKQLLSKACRQMAEWKRQDPRFGSLQVSVNLSNRQLCDNQLVANIRDLLQDTGLSGRELRLEVTESTIMKNPERGALILSQLRELGVKVAIDDFGTGYSSLASIHDLSPDVVKIDRSFIDTLATCPDKQTIVGAIIAVAEGLNLDVVAEGVETIAQREILLSMGCGFAQGYLFSRPLSPEAMQAFLYERAAGGRAGSTNPAPREHVVDAEPRFLRNIPQSNEP